MRAFLAIGLGAAGLIFPGCGLGPEHPEPVVEMVERYQDPVVARDLGVEHYLPDRHWHRVEGHPDVAEFFLLERISEIEKFPCSSCHTKPLSELQRAQEGRRSAHWDVRLNHAEASVMECATCHPSADLDRLHTIRHVPVDFDHSYQICAQCHQGEARDWAGGAHGRREGGWAPPRVVLNCTGCHDPHATQFPARLPTPVFDFRPAERLP